jgi:hypothetical protein
MLDYILGAFKFISVLLLMESKKILNYIKIVFKVKYLILLVKIIYLYWFKGVFALLHRNVLSKFVFLLLTKTSV